MGLFDMLTGGGSNQRRTSSNDDKKVYWHRCLYCGRQELLYSTRYVNTQSCPSRPASLPHDFRRI